MPLDPDTKSYLDEHFQAVNTRLDKGDKRFERIETAISGDRLTPGAAPGLAARVEDLERQRAADEVARAKAEDKRVWWQRLLSGGLVLLGLERLADYFFG